MTDTRTALVTAIADALGLHPDGIADNQTLAELGADSLDMVEITMNIENALELADHIDPEIIEIGTLAQIVTAIDAMRGQA